NTSPRSSDFTTSQRYAFCDGRPHFEPARRIIRQSGEPAGSGRPQPRLATTSADCDIAIKVLCAPSEADSRNTLIACFPCKSLPRSWLRRDIDVEVTPKRFPIHRCLVASGWQ